MDGETTVAPGFAAGVLSVLDCWDTGVELKAEVLSLLDCCAIVDELVRRAVVVIEGS